MQEILNEEAYKVEKDGLVYDLYAPIDVKNVTVTIEAGTMEALKRGQLIDFDETEGKYKPHAAEGAANCIVARDVKLTTRDTDAVASVYISGNFRASSVVTEEELTEKDVENLRSKNIILR